MASVKGDAAVVRPRVDTGRIAAIAKRITALGFWHVTIDLDRLAGQIPRA